MIFTSLKITGFKSFAEPETFAIEPGLTGIVGPNGCGKSNIVEAIRWIMGESAARTMRGSELEDIIFAGTINRPARNFAEVTLHLDNTARTAPLTNLAANFPEQDALEITRRIERGKGSSFWLNGKPLRARDIQLLFADIATGSRSSGIVSQGRVGALINAKPVERRALLEEAANIRGLHQRRREAELRLNAAENNLERLQDILGQLDNQKTSLAKQARQAARYRSIADRIRKAEAQLLMARWIAISNQLNETGQQQNQATQRVAAATETASRSSRLRDEAAEALPPLRQQNAEKSAELQRLRLALASLDEEENWINQAVTDIERQLGQLAEDLSREEQLRDDADKAIAELEQTAARLETEAADSGPRRQAATAALNSARSQADAAETAYADAAAKNRAAQRERDQIDRQSAQLEQQLDQLRQTLANLELPPMETEATQARSALITAEAATETLASRLQQATNTCQKLRQQAETQTAAQIEIRRQMTTLEAEAEALGQLLGRDNQKAGSPASAQIKVGNRMEPALAAVLGEALNAPVGTTEQQPGNDAYWCELPITSSLVPPHGTTPLKDYLELPAALETALAGIGIVASAEEASQAQQHLLPGQALTTAEGGLWRWDGYVLPLGAATSTETRLRQESRLRSLEADIAAIAKQEQQATANAEQALSARDKAEAEQSRLQAELRQAETAALAAARHHDQTQTALAAASSRQEELATRIGETEARQQQLVTEKIALGDTENLQQEEAKAAAIATNARKQLAEAMGDERALRDADTQHRQRMASLAEEQERWQNRRHGATARLDELATRKTATLKERQRLQTAPKEIASRRQTMAEQHEKATLAHQQSTDRLAIAEAELTEAEQRQKADEAALAEAREALIRFEANFQMATSNRDALALRIREKLDCTPEALPQLAELSETQSIEADEAALSQLENRLERLLRERENIGPVNLRAETEMTELEQQITSLQAEQQDLNAAISKLRGGINQLNREGRSRLLASFAEVNRHFSTLFKALFNGGSAEVQLTKTDDPLEAGLEILASPPGKKLQALSLLSGGEQALTALALIFAVFLTNPAPICILDEVDAPLDDSNVSRFCDLLQQLAQQTGTRFIIVTHHRLTMARMDRLYGVTMEQRGISRIVSVDLQTAETYRESA